MAFRYMEKIREILDKVERTQIDAMENTARVLADCLAADGVIHVFGTGHSHMLVEESFYRAGGLAPINPVFDPGLMLHHGARKSSKLERLPGYARIILEECGAQRGDVIIVISNSGVNAVPVEMALEAKALGMTVIAITAREYADSVPAKHPSGKRLHDIADHVIDNCGVKGDGVVPIAGTDQKAGPSSTVVGAAILNSVYVRVVELLQEKGQVPPVWISANMPGASEHNEKLLAKYRNRIRFL